MRCLLSLLFLSACAHSGAPAEPDASHRGHQHHRGHRFQDAEAWAGHFESPSRDAWQMPERVVEALDLAPDMRVADVGAGTGYFAVRLARAVPQGKVFAADIEPDMVRYVDERAARENLSNLSGVLATADDPHLPEAVDRVVIVNTLHHMGDRTAYFQRLRGSLRAGAWVVIIDFRMGELPVGPPDAMKLPPDVVEAELEAAGYEVSLRHDFLPHQYLLVFVPSPGA